jgi:predicted ATPase
VAQIGAVLGRDFAYPLLHDVSERDEPALQASLDRLADADLLFVEGAPPQANYRFKHALIQDAAYESLLKSRRQALHRRAAEILRDDPQRAAAEPEVIAHHFTQAGLDDPAIEWWGRAGDLALRRSAFQEAIAHLGKAIAMADKTGAASTPRAAAPTAAESQQLKLHTRLGQAMMHSRGYGSEESKTAFARARTLAAGVGDASERFDAYYGLFIGSYARGELSLARETAESFLRDAETEGRMSEAAGARRNAGMACLFQGDLVGAEAHLAEALRTYDPARDRDARYRFGLDTGAGAAMYLALASWAMGGVERARALGEEALARADETAHAPTRGSVYYHFSLYQVFRGDPEAAKRTATIAADLGREHGMTFWLALGEVLSNWARARLEDRESGMTGLREALAAHLGQGNKIYVPLINGQLAELEAEGDDADGALTRIDAALALASQTGERWTDALLHRIRGDILLKCNRADPAHAEEAYQTAIAIAKQQRARSYGLLASLSLAKLYQSTARLVEAYEVLAAALDGFSPNPEMPEIVEAQTLLAALPEMDEVKAAITQRDRLARLHVARANALIAARGYGARETSDAFAMALAATGDKTAPERLAADFGLWVGAFNRGEVDAMRVHAARFLADASAAPNSPETGVAERIVGLTDWFVGAPLEARPHLERALSLFEPGRDDDLAFRFGHDTGVGHMANLAICLWMLGEVGRAVDLMNQAEARASSLPQAASRALGNFLAAMFNLMRCDRARAAANGARLAQLAQEHDLEMWRAFAVFFDWGADPPGAARPLDKMRRGLELLRGQGVQLYDGLLKSALASEEAKAGHLLRAVDVVDEALANAMRMGQKTFDAELHRLRGEALAQFDPDNVGPGEEALRRAIEIARQQGARSFELRAALSLAKLYQSTGRPVEAHAVLAPTLEGFSPTPEMPEIAEAQELLVALNGSDDVKAVASQRQRRGQLQVAYANALIAARGFSAPETAEAFAKAHALSTSQKDAPERLAANYGLWAGSYTRGDLPSMRAHTEAFLSDIGPNQGSPEAGVADRVAGITCWFAGEYRQARDHLERALALFQPGRDDDLAFRFGQDAGAAALAYLALVSWPLGEIDLSISLINRMQARIADLTHVSTVAFGRVHAAVFEQMRGDPARAAPNALEVARLAREHQLTMFHALGVFLEGCATAANGAPGDGIGDMRHGVELLREQGVLLFDGIFKIGLSEAEARAGDLGRAVATLDEALASSERTGCHAFEAELHRARGEMLLRRDPTDFAPVQQALQTAVAVARQQGTRAFELRAALSLAKLWQSTDRPAEAHTVLAPALEGFSPTSEMSEIPEAQAVLTALVEVEEVRSDGHSPPSPNSRSQVKTSPRGSLPFPRNV